MYSVMVAFGLAGVMLCLGMTLRGKVKPLQSMLMPVSVIGGVFGFVFVNLVMPHVDICGVSTTDFSNIVDVFFVMSFISIGLTGSRKKKEKAADKGEKKKASGPVRGAMGMALIWCILYALTPTAGIIIVALIGKAFDMNPMYGILIPFAFCQGPGQSSTYGKLFEGVYGFENAEMVALTFAALGFIAAFGIGVPLARYGLRKGLAKNKAKINEAVERGYLTPEEQRESLGKVTFHSANIETVGAHLAIMGVTYLLSLVLAKIVSYVPVLGSSLSAMLFMWGMFAAYIVKAVMRKLKIDYLINNVFQSRLTGFLSDFLVVCSFMAIQISVIGRWIVPILVVSIAGAVITYFVCLYFGERLGSDHDFERVLGVFGTCTGTTPSGVSLVRMVDPRLQTPAGAELGVMNAAMILSTPTVTIITFAGLQMLSLPVACAAMLVTVLIYLILLKVFGAWRKPTFTLKKGKIYDGVEDDSDVPFLKGYLHYVMESGSEDLEKTIKNSWN